MKLIAKYFVYSTVLVIIFCKHSKAQYSGTFARGGIETETFCFKTDGTFKYISSLHLQDINCEGFYKINGDTIILNSLIQREDILQVKKWNIPCSDSVYISLKMVSGLPPTLTILHINDTIKIEISDTVTNVLRFKRDFLKKFSVESIFLPHAATYNNEINISNNNIIEVLLNDTYGSQVVFFKNQKFLYKKSYIQSLMDKDYKYISQKNIECK